MFSLFSRVTVAVSRNRDSDFLSLVDGAAVMKGTVVAGVVAVGWAHDLCAAWSDVDHYMFCTRVFLGKIGIHAG